MAGREGGENLPSHLGAKRMIAEKYLARRFLSIQQALGERESDNAYWAPGTEKPADGLTKVRSNAAPLLRLSESGHFNPKSLRRLKEAAWEERADLGQKEN